MGRQHLGVPTAAWLAIGLWTGCAAVCAQDRFDDKLPAARPGQSTQKPASVTPPPVPTAGAPGEGQDFGVRPVSQLRASDQLHGPTPTSIPGGRVVGTQELAQWMQGQQGQQGRVMLLHAIVSDAHLPNAIPAAPASQGGSFDDTVQREFGDYLQRATGGDRSRLLVTYCQGVQCWGSYNAALRAIQLGYKNVHWYRGGMEAWAQAGLPVLNASGTGGSSTPRPNQAPPR